MDVYPLYGNRTVMSLDGIWDFEFFEDKGLDAVPSPELAFTGVMCVPGAFDCSPDFYCKRGTGVYRRMFSLAKECANTLLKIGGMGLRTKVWLDGAVVGESCLAYSGIEFETGALAAGGHELVIAVDNTFQENNSELFHPYYDFYAFGGIYRSVELHLLPRAYCIDRVQIRTVDYTQGKVNLQVLFRGDVPASVDVRMRFDTSASFEEKQLAVKNGMAELELVVPANKLWSPEEPNLHTLELVTDGDSIVEQFGIREIKTAGKKMLLNGKELYLKGFNRHESHPEFGPASPEQLMLEDLQNLKELNGNFIRGCHYPQDQRFLQMCDRMGVLVWEESLGWGNRPEQLSDDLFISRQLEQTRLMVRNSINHPCIVIWAFMNEFGSQSQEGLALCEKLVAAIKEEDFSRLVTFACSKTHDDICSGMLDIISFNTYPGWIHTESLTEPMDEIRPEMERCVEYFEKLAGREIPIIASEMGTCAIYGQHDRALAQWTEEFQDRYLTEVLSTLQDLKDVSGIAIWQMNDAKSYLRKGAGIRAKPMALNLAGVFDQYRRRKLSADTVKSFWADMG